MPATRKPRRPSGLKRSATLWDEITGAYQLRPDEYRLLEDVCRTADLIDRLQRTIDDDGVTTTGSQGQVVTHPAVGEIRQHRAVLKTMWTSLALPDADDGDQGTGGKGTGAGSDAGRALAAARWGGRKTSAG